MSDYANINMILNGSFCTTPRGHCWLPCPSCYSDHAGPVLGYHISVSSPPAGDDSHSEAHVSGLGSGHHALRPPSYGHWLLPVSLRTVTNYLKYIFKLYAFWIVSLHIYAHKVLPLGGKLQGMKLLLFIKQAIL